MRSGTLPDKSWEKCVIMFNCPSLSLDNVTPGMPAQLRCREGGCGNPRRFGHVQVTACVRSECPAGEGHSVNACCLMRVSLHKHKSFAFVISGRP